MPKEQNQKMETGATRATPVPRQGLKRNGFGRAVSRILSARITPGRESFVSAADTRDPFHPASAGRNLERAAPRSSIWPCTRWGFPCPADYSPGGGLLHHLFTLAEEMECWGTGVLEDWDSCFPIIPSLHHANTPLPPRFVFCGTVRRDASRRRRPRVSRDEVGVTRHRALWCSDFPPPIPRCGTGSDSPPFQNRHKNTLRGRVEQGVN